MIYLIIMIFYKEVNCNGCENIIIWKDYFLCLNMVINKIERVNMVSMYWSIICKLIVFFVK